VLTPTLAAEAEADRHETPINADANNAARGKNA
jgi:hypothetical protein